MAAQRLISFTVALNGTRVNPFERMGLTQNPFPQIADSRYDRWMLNIQKLGGPPIPEDHEKYIRETLIGCSEELIEICVLKFRRGEYVTFQITFPEG